jgi:hypothetical protein
MAECGGHAINPHPGFDPDRVGGGCGQSVIGAMIPVPSGVRVWPAVGHTDMRRGMNRLALQVQEGLKRDPSCQIEIVAGAMKWRN